MAPSARVSICA